MQLRSSVRTSPTKPQAISSAAGQQRSLSPRIVLGIFGLMVSLFGIAFLALTLSGVREWYDSGNWLTHTCRVLTSSVQEHTGSDSVTYSVDIVYDYQLQGVLYRSRRYDFFEGSSSGYDSKQKIVAEYPPQKNVTCYINPADPERAVLTRDLPSALAIFAAVGALTLLAGIALLSVTCLRSPKGNGASSGGARGPEPAGPPYRQSSGALLLQPQSSSKAKFFGVLLIALFWNSIISVFIVEAGSGWRHGSPDYFLSIFLIPFVLIGVFLIGATVHQFLALFNPQITLTISAAALCPGEEFTLNWVLKGRTERLRSLTVKLQAEEVVTYRRGTQTSTDRSVFYSRELLRTTALFSLLQGEVKGVLPAESIPSFNAPNNQIVWQIVVQGEIPHWPDLLETYTLKIAPLPRRLP